MEQIMECAVNCAKCPGPVCNSPAFMEGPDDRPTRVEADVIQGTMEKYHSPEFAEFVRVASVVEGSSFTRVPWAPRGNSPLTTRLEEVISFAKQMGYNKLGVAFCGGFMNEAKVLIPILENKGFEVVSVCCKAGGIPTGHKLLELGLRDIAQDLERRGLLR